MIILIYKIAIFVVRTFFYIKLFLKSTADSNALKLKEMHEKKKKKFKSNESNTDIWVSKFTPSSWEFEMLRV